MGGEVDGPTWPVSVTGEPPDAIHPAGTLSRRPSHPTPEGGVQAEWELGQWEVSLEIALPSMAAEYQAVNLTTSESHELELSLAADDVASWTELNNALTQLQEGNV